jgi:hypothetical protein
VIVSQFGRLGIDAGVPDVVMRPTEVDSYLPGTTIDLRALRRPRAVAGRAGGPARRAAGLAVTWTPAPWRESGCAFGRSRRHAEG